MYCKDHYNNMLGRLMNDGQYHSVLEYGISIGE